MDTLGLIQVATVVVAFFLKRPAALAAVLIAYTATAIHTAIAEYLTWAEYYAYAVALDVLAAVLISALSPVCRTALGMLLVILAAALGNVAGLFMWLSYIGPEAYDAAFICIYLAAFAVVVWGLFDDTGSSTVAWRFSWLARFSRTGRARRSSRLQEKESS